MNEMIQSNDKSLQAAESFAQNASGTTEKTLSEKYADAWNHASADSKVNGVLKDPAYC